MNCGNAVYDDSIFRGAIESGLDRLVGYSHPTPLSAGSTVYLLGVPRVQDLYFAGIVKQTGVSDIDCEAFWDDFDVCEIATVDAAPYGENLATRIPAIAERVQRYNEILRDVALEYATNVHGRNVAGIEVVADYVNEEVPSVGTTPFGANEINGGDCFHPSILGQNLVSEKAWSSNPREPVVP
jgi:hypothetical protein